MSRTILPSEPRIEVAAPSLKLGGEFGIRVVDHRQDKIITPWRKSKNLITNQGLAHLAERGFDGLGAATWYIGFVEKTGAFTAAPADDDHHALIVTRWGFSFENFADWSTSVRGTWSPNVVVGADSGAGAAPTITTTGTVDQINNSGGDIDVRGCFLTSVSSSGIVSDILFAATDTGTNNTVGDGQTMQLTYDLGTWAATP